MSDKPPAKLTVTWINHASFRLQAGATVVYIDPWKIPAEARDGDVVLISHSHYDHLSAEDIAKVARPGGAVIGPADVTAKLKHGRVLAPGQELTVGPVTVRAIPAYNVDKQFHPRANGWLGLIVSLAGRKVYYAGDTDCIDEMRQVGAVDLALLPVGGTYTMDAAAAAKATSLFKADRIVPYHWGDIVGSNRDAEQLADALGDDRVRILRPGGSITVG